MGYALLKEKPLLGQNLSSSPKTATERAADRWFSREKPQSDPESASGLIVYNLNRYYDPQLGRYITSDRIGLAGGANTYSYALQNPVRYVDPDGSIALNPLTGAAAGAVGGGFGAFVGTFSVTRDPIASFYAGLEGGAFGLASGFVAGFGGGSSRIATGLGIGLDLLLNTAVGAGAEEMGGFDPVLPVPLPSANSLDPVSEQIQRQFCLLNPDAPNCQEDEPNNCE